MPRRAQMNRARCGLRVVRSGFQVTGARLQASREMFHVQAKPTGHGTCCARVYNLKPCNLQPVTPMLPLVFLAPWW